MAVTSLGSQTIGDVGSLLISPALHLQVQQKWTDTVDLISACVDLGSVNGSGSLAHKVPIMDPSALEAGAVAEGTAVTLADPADSSLTITVAKQKAGFGMTDELAIISPLGYDIETLSGLLVDRAGMQATDLVCATFPNFTAGEAAGSPNSVGLFLANVFNFRALRPPSGQGICVLHDTQARQLIQSYRAEGQGDILTRNPDTNPAAGMVHMMQGYLGTPMRGIHVVETTRVTTASSNYEGAIIGVPLAGPDGRNVGGSIFYKWADQSMLGRYATGQVRLSPVGKAIAGLYAQLIAAGQIAPNMVPPAIMLMLTMGRVELTGETAVYGQFMLGCTADPAKGVRYRTAT